VHQPKVETVMRESAFRLPGAVDDAGEGGETDQEIGDGKSDQTVVCRLFHAFHRAHQTPLTEDDQVQQVSTNAEHADYQNHLRVDEFFDELSPRQGRRRHRHRLVQIQSVLRFITTFREVHFAAFKLPFAFCLLKLNLDKLTFVRSQVVDEIVVTDRV